MITTTPRSVRPALPELGFGCWSTPNASLPELCQLARDAGFRRVTVHPYMFAEATADGRWPDALRRLVDDAGLEVFHGFTRASTSSVRSNRSA